MGGQRPEGASALVEKAAEQDWQIGLDFGLFPSMILGKFEGSTSLGEP